MTFDPGNRLIAALDVPERAAADALVARLDHAASWLKIGLELFCAEGPALVRDYTAGGHRVMLDLKLHDIPATVRRATARAAALGAELLTVHAGGGRAMLQAAVEGTVLPNSQTQTAPDAVSATTNAGFPQGTVFPNSQTRGRTRILAVTVLTSMDDRDLAEIGCAGTAEELVLRRAQLAIEAGCDGVVASPHEAARLRTLAPDGFLIVTPGVRPAGADAGDQKRVMTAAEARRAGADLVVVGRPIRDAADPAAAARALAAELAGA
jgi:orotidine-5'-phosphate decarboxylase